MSSTPWRPKTVALLVGALMLSGCSAGTTPPPGTATASGDAPATAAPSGSPSAPAPPTAAAAPALPAVASDPAQAYLDATTAVMSLREKIRSLFLLHVPGTDASVLRSYLDEHRPAGLILMGDNVTDAAQSRALAEAITPDRGLPPLLAIDQEGGVVERLPDPWPAAEELAALPPQATADAFGQRATMLQSAGVDVNFGIIADVTGDPQSFLGERVLGGDPVAAAERVAAAVRGEDGLVASTLKHYPGHGAAPGDSHVSLPSTTRTLEEWRSLDALPFRAGIDAGAELVMTAHVTYSAVDPAPASLSPLWHRILRDELAFEGVIVTDDMLMLQYNGLAEFSDPGANAVRALQAGADLLLYVLPADPSELGVDLRAMVERIAAEVESGALPEAQLDASLARVLALRLAAR